MRSSRGWLVVFGMWLGGCQAPAPEPIGWRPLSTGSTASIRGLAAFDDEVAYVSGTAGTLLRTVDGGATWRSVAPAGTEDCDFRDVEALDRDRVVAMVAGQPARVYRSDDGGEHWRLVHEDPRPAAFLDAMAFAGDTGMIFGDAIDGRFCMLQTDDGGRTWWDRSGDLLPPPRAGEAAFAASGTCLVAADPGRLLFSLVTGGGPCRSILFGPGASEAGHPRHHPLPLRSGGSSLGAFSVAWRGPQAVAVGGDYREPLQDRGTAAVTADGGETWRASNAGGFRSAVIWLGADTLLAVGSHGASWSGDAGETWQAFGDVGFHCLCRGRDGSVWAAGSDGRVAKLVMAR